MKKRRLDDVLIADGRARDRADAFIIVTEGRVFVDGQKAVSPAQWIGAGAVVTVRGGDEYVGRGAHKLAGALERFGVDLAGKICLDIGAATGGFTEVMLKAGALKVYAIDTARGKLALKLREDSRVIVMEGTNALYLDALPERADFASVDVSLTSLRHVLPALARFLKPGGSAALLFKPQYETRDPRVLKNGVVRDDAARRALLEDFIAFARQAGWDVVEWMESPIKGSTGNTEYLLYMRARSNHT